MRKLAIFTLAGVTAATLAGAAIAADREAKTMKVPLADGSTVAIEYYGDVAPKVTVVPATHAQRLSHWMFPDFAGIDRMIADMNRQTAEMMRRMHEMRRQGMVGGLPPVNLASTGTMPAGASSVSIVTVSNGGRSCTRTTEVVSQGAGKAPSVTSSVSGDCDTGVKGAEPAAVNQT